jgi:hypothetical protein
MKRSTVPRTTILPCFYNYGNVEMSPQVGFGPALQEHAASKNRIAIILIVPHLAFVIRPGRLPRTAERLKAIPGHISPPHPGPSSSGRALTTQSLVALS